MNIKIFKEKYMSQYCIISEFNPLHNGHAYLISKSREMGAESVTCVMSGNATQRGELAIVDKYLRAEAAVRCGADLVLELPYPWCMSSAEYFATAAISIASHFCDTLLFGSECADIELLKGAAAACETMDFKTEFEQRGTAGEGAAAAYISCLEHRGFCGFSSNDLLGIAYIRAINRLGADMQSVTARRLGAAYNSDTAEGEGFQSATALRNCIRTRLSDAKEYMPEIMWRIIQMEADNGGLTDIACLDSLILGYFRLANGDQLESIAECSGGIANRICDTARRSTSATEMLEALRTKRYTDARLRRAALFCMTGVEQKHISALPEYTTLLAANGRGRALLAKKRKLRGITVVTKPADAPKDSFQYLLSDKLDSIYTLARTQKLTADAFLKKGTYIDHTM
ncbi:MAG: nucleotidyltransferase family protein [Clostridia bacterium]|nr:nucleotidyltransferase family protein [Clostridia bacterium]